MAGRRNTEQRCAAAARAYLIRIAEWEAFLNGASNKQRLMSRYLFEHLFLASFVFTDTDVPNQGRQFFRLVRSRTPPGQPVDVIATRMPFNDPGSKKFWYRIEPTDATVVSKIHMPYGLSSLRMARFQQLFLDADFEVKSFPGYDRKTASNPFLAYREVPVDSRYRFMLDDAEFFIRGFMKGPVCRGQVAVDVIEDRFWVVFQSPASVLTMRSSEFLARESASLRLPAESSTGLGPGALVGWRKYKNAQMRFLMAKQASLGASTAGVPVNLDTLWDGDGHNTNASLTIMRHFDNASVIRGLHGAAPKTAWVIDYSLFERIHYLLVAGFDVFGPLDHQVGTRLYMDFLRMGRAAGHGERASGLHPGTRPGAHQRGAPHERRKPLDPGRRRVGGCARLRGVLPQRAVPGHPRAAPTIRAGRGQLDVEPRAGIHRLACVGPRLSLVLRRARRGASAARAHVLASACRRAPPRPPG